MTSIDDLPKYWPQFITGVENQYTGVNAWASEKYNLDAETIDFYLHQALRTHADKTGQPIESLKDKLVNTYDADSQLYGASEPHQTLLERVAQIKAAANPISNDLTADGLATLEKSLLAQSLSLLILQGLANHHVSAMQRYRQVASLEIVLDACSESDDETQQRQAESIRQYIDKAKTTLESMAAVPLGDLSDEEHVEALCQAAHRKAKAIEHYTLQAMQVAATLLLDDDTNALLTRLRSLYRIELGHFYQGMEPPARYDFQGQYALDTLKKQKTKTFNWFSSRYTESAYLGMLPDQSHLIKTFSHLPSPRHFPLVGSQLSNVLGAQWPSLSNWLRETRPEHMIQTTVSMQYKPNSLTGYVEGIWPVITTDKTFHPHLFVQLVDGYLTMLNSLELQLIESGKQITQVPLNLPCKNTHESVEFCKLRAEAAEIAVMLFSQNRVQARQDYAGQLPVIEIQLPTDGSDFITEPTNLAHTFISKFEKLPLKPQGTSGLVSPEDREHPALPQLMLKQWTQKLTISAKENLKKCPDEPKSPTIPDTATRIQQLTSVCLQNEEAAIRRESSQKEQELSPEEFLAWKQKKVEDFQRQRQALWQKTNLAANSLQGGNTTGINVVVDEKTMRKANTLRLRKR